MLLRIKVKFSVKVSERRSNQKEKKSDKKKVKLLKDKLLEDASFSLKHFRWALNPNWSLDEITAQPERDSDLSDETKKQQRRRS